MKTTGLSAVQNWRSSFALLLFGPAKVARENLGSVIQFGGWISMDLNSSMNIFFLFIYTQNKHICSLQKHVPDFSH